MGTNRAGAYADRAKERGVNRGAVESGWVVAVAAGILIGAASRGTYGLVAGLPVERGEVVAAAVITSLLTGSLSYLAGGYAAGRMAGAPGGVNGAMTAVFGLALGIVLGLVLAGLGLIAFGGDGLPAAPVGFGGIAGGAFLAGLVLFLANLFGGYVGGKLGEPSRPAARCTR